MVGCLRCSIAMIYDLWDGSLDQRKVCGSGPLSWSGWLSSPSTAIPHRYLQIHYNTIVYQKSKKFQQVCFIVFKNHAGTFMILYILNKKNICQKILSKNVKRQNSGILTQRGQFSNPVGQSSTINQPNQT